MVGMAKMLKVDPESMILGLVYCVMAFGIQTAYAQLPMLGPCPRDVISMRNFSFVQFLGVWHEHYRYFIRGEEGHTCVVLNMENNGDGAIGITIWNYNECFDKDTVTRGTGKLGGRSRDDGRLLISFSYGPDLPFWVIDTDYVTYAAVWGCSDYCSISSQYAWILTRDVCPPPEAIQKAMSAFRINGIVTRPLMRTIDNVCYPEDSVEDDYDW